uniref:LIM zinc-binding domain-containing protein n=1 Tax=Dendroctonus ponderosae TaxID=77166 RepID=A0AAR5Q693_DENPD
MDRSMYGKMVPGTRNPFECTMKHGTAAPGYALLADLQSTVSGGVTGGGNVAGYGSLNNPRPRQAAPNDAVTVKAQPHNLNTGTYGKTQPVAGGRLVGATGARPNNSSLVELDNLLEDLSTSRYANVPENGVNGAHSRPGSAQNSLDRPSSAQGAYNRPSVDDLLQELDQGDVIYAGPKKVVITVKETKTETGFPGETELVSAHTTRAASSATRELDDLMASLSNIKVNQRPQQPVQEENARPTKATQSQGAPISPPANLDSMLDNLQADMSRQGVNTSQKGCCSACEKPIVGQVITALGKTWHPEHFTCAHCTQELGTRNFFEREGKPYCEPDYHNLFSPRCAYCNGPILDKCVTALEKTWHMDHFFCAQCGKQFGEDGFHEREGKPYCRDDYFDMFAPKCGACNRAIMENYISALNTQWHPDCFVCRDCRQPFIGGSFFDHEGQPYCETHYHLKRGSLCAGCHKPISGRCVTAMFRKFHPEHFVCAFCLKQLNKGTFKEQSDKPYCHMCFEKLFG